MQGQAPLISNDLPDEQQLLRLAVACVEERKFEDALLHLKQLLAASPEKEVALGMLAAIYAEIGMVDRAIDHYDRTLAVNPANHLARFQLGLLRVSLRHWQEALDTWQPLLDHPQDYLAHYHSGLVLLQQEKRHEARSLLAKAAERLPESHSLYPLLQALLKKLDH